MYLLYGDQNDGTAEGSVQKSRGKKFPLTNTKTRKLNYFNDFTERSYMF